MGEFSFCTSIVAQTDLFCCKGFFEQDTQSEYGSFPWSYTSVELYLGVTMIRTAQRSEAYGFLGKRENQ